MKKNKVIHKLDITPHGDYIKCNPDTAFETLGSYHWRNVTCKKCLKMRGRK